MTVPEFLPVLSAGAHSNPAQGACVMEYVSLLAGEPFSDSPACTHPVLAAAARVVNDGLGDDERYRLVPLIGRLFGTADQREPVAQSELSAALAKYAAEYAESVARYAAESARYAAESAAGGVAEGVEFLTGLLDEYDRLTGRRTRPTMVNESTLRALASQVGGAR